MGLFFKRDVAETTPTDDSLVTVVEAEYQESKREFNAASAEERSYAMTHSIPPQFFVRDNKVMVPMNANERTDPTHDRLKAKKEYARQKFCERMRQRADLRMRLGLSR